MTTHPTMTPTFESAMLSFSPGVNSRAELVTLASSGINSRGYFRQYIIWDLNNGNKKQLARFFFSIGLLCTIFFPCIFCVREFFLVFAQPPPPPPPKYLMVRP